MIKTINLWHTEDLDLNTILFPPNKTFNYNNESIKINTDTLYPQKIYDMRKSAEVHRQTRKEIQKYIKPGMKIIDICSKIENIIKKKLPNKNEGIGFPVGININNIAAHDSAIVNDERIIQKNDIIKLDYGTHINGNIIDSAFTIAFDNHYDNLINATKEATNEGIKMANIDTLISEISDCIEEVIGSYEQEINNRTYTVNSVSNLGGHNILPYEIHGGKLILGKRSSLLDNSIRMCENECYAIETFATTGNGTLFMDPNIETTHFMINKKKQKQNTRFKFKQTHKVYSHIKNTYDTMPFCSRWLNNDLKGFKIGLKELVSCGIVDEYPAMIDKKEHRTAQTEHTIFLHNNHKEILSKGDDY